MSRSSVLMTTTNPVCVCGCGRSYSAEAWAALALVGEQTWPWGEVIELRNCSCGSTRAIVLVEGDVAAE